MIESLASFSTGSISRGICTTILTRKYFPCRVCKRFSPQNRPIFQDEGEAGMQGVRPHAFPLSGAHARTCEGGHIASLSDLGGEFNGICKSRVIEASRSPATTPPIPILSRPLSHPISQFASYRFHHRTTKLSGEKLKLPAVLLSRCVGVIHFLRLRHPSG